MNTIITPYWLTGGDGSVHCNGVCTQYEFLSSGGTKLVDFRFLTSGGPIGRKYPRAGTATFSPSWSFVFEPITEAWLERMNPGEPVEKGKVTYNPLFYSEYQTAKRWFEQLNGPIQIVAGGK